MTIWKRSARLGTALESSEYIVAIAELEGLGRAERKRARKAGFVPAWGDGLWDRGVAERRDGVDDFLAARGMYDVERKGQVLVTLRATWLDAVPRSASCGLDC